MHEPYGPAREEVTAPKADTGAARPGVIAFPPLVFLAGFLAGLLLELFDPRSLFPQVPIRALGAVMALLGVALAVWGRNTMVRAGTDPNPYRPSKQLVTEGPFRFTRNPMYVAMTAAYVGLALLFDAFWSLILLPLVLIVTHFGIVLREERYLERTFGEPYRAYRKRVRRWF